MRLPIIKTFRQKKLKETNILFVTHTHVVIFSELFKSFISQKFNSFTIIRHPLFPVKGTKSVYFAYKQHNLRKHYNFSRLPAPYVINFIKDFMLTLYWVLMTDSFYDIAFGTNNMNVISLLLLKKMGRINKVIYVSIDYTPQRYDNPILDLIYHWFDKICCYQADIIWNSSRRMNEERSKHGIDLNKIAKTIIIPDGSNFNAKKRLPMSKINRFTFIFLGNMRPVMGVELMLSSFKDVLLDIPQAKFLLIGGGPNLEEYKQLAKNLHLGDSVKFTGLIKHHKDVDDLLRKGAIGLAPFVPDKSSYEFYSDVGKPKSYLAAGMPVIITRVPEIADIIEREKAGFVVEYTQRKLSQAMLLLLQDDTLYRQFRSNAIRLSKRYIWNNLFTTAMNDSLSFFNKE